MNADTPARTGGQVAGPARDALELLYRFVAAIELSPTVAVHALGRDGSVLLWNQACSTLYGIGAPAAVGRPLHSLIAHPGQEDEFHSQLKSIWATGAAAPARDWLVVPPDGRERWVFSSMFPLWQDGVLHQIVCMDVDISERKRSEAALLDSGIIVRELFARTPDAVILLHGQLIIEANSAAVRLFGRTDRTDLLGRTLLDFSPPTQPSGEPSASADAAFAQQALADGSRLYEWNFALPDGSDVIAEVLLTSISMDQDLLSYAMIRDVSSRKDWERELQMAAQVFEHCRDAIELIDCDYRIVAVNKAFTDITGFLADDVVGQTVHNLRNGVHDSVFYQQVWEQVELYDHWKGELWSTRKNGELYPLSVALTAVRGPDRKVLNFMAIMADITERKRSEEQTRHLAEHDFLTDLPNRVLFLDRLQHALATARRKHTKVALLFLDLDRFKSINDNYGHPVGDLLLKEVAVRLSKCVRNVDTVSRQGGDEFVIILADIGGEEQAAHVATTVMQAIEQIGRVGEAEVNVGSSIGISIYPDDGTDADMLLKHADVAMYHAKQDGRSQFQFFSAAMNAHVIARIELENKLRHALSNNEFVLEYQPEIHIETGDTVALEALIRWRHPELGMLLPDQFIPAAEGTGLIVPIGEWVLQQACLKVRALRDQGYPLRVSVNLASVQFLHPNLLGCVDEALARSGLPGDCLELEVTESVLMNGNAATIATVDGLGQRGVHLTVDDFGTGVSSLSHLRRFPLSKLKIDRSFIDEISDKPGDAAIIPAIIAVARSLKLRVVAEGVETADQLRFLQQHGCDDYQGFYHRPAGGGAELNA